MHIDKNNYNIIDAIVYKILSFCEENEISINKLAEKCDISQSTLQSIINFENKSIKIITLYKICCGMNITMQEFFKDSLFDNVNDTL